jgi:hypothetical protein
MSLSGRQRTRASRALGYTIAAVVNSVLLYLVNVAPGWDAVPFLSPDAAQVVPVFNATLVVGIVGNIVNIIVDRRWTRAVTEILSACVSLAFIVATWRVFPFTFDGATVQWSVITRVVLVFAALGCGISVIVQIVALAAQGRRAAARRNTAGT